MSLCTTSIIAKKIDEVPKFKHKRALVLIARKLVWLEFYDYFSEGFIRY